MDEPIVGGPPSLREARVPARLPLPLCGPRACPGAVAISGGPDDRPRGERRAGRARAPPPSNGGGSPRVRPEDRRISADRRGRAGARPIEGHSGGPGGGRRPVGYAVVQPSRLQTICGELAAASARIRKPLVAEIERRSSTAVLALQQPPVSDSSRRSEAVGTGSCRRGGTRSWGAVSITDGNPWPRSGNSQRAIRGSSAYPVIGSRGSTTPPWRRSDDQAGSGSGDGAGELGVSRSRRARVGRWANFWCLRGPSTSSPKTTASPPIRVTAAAIQNAY
jgi:hypothetical protein